MPSEGKNLKDTLREVVGETGKAVSAKPPPIETKESSPVGLATETKAGEPVR